MEKMELTIHRSGQTGQSLVAPPESWRDLLRRPVRDLAERNRMAAELAEVKTPAPRVWILARIASLMQSYPQFGDAIPESIAVLDANDWAAALAAYPQWAIDRAVQWWRGADNDRRRQKPQPGDIAARARHEMGLVFFAEHKLRQFDGCSAGVSRLSETDDRPRVTAEEADAILAKAGFRPRRMNGGGDGSAA